MTSVSAVAGKTAGPGASFTLTGSVQDLFFQAEDGIRDHCVTGVQTCVLPIWLEAIAHRLDGGDAAAEVSELGAEPAHVRSEERRVGKECRGRWWPGQERKW